MSAADASRAAPVDPETLARLAGGLAHELKNPLSTIGLHLSLLEEDLREEDGSKAQRARRTIDTVKREVQHLQGILEDFLRFARTDRLDRHPRSLNELVEEVVRFASPECAVRGIKVATHLDLGLPELPVDGSRLRQVLLNLVLNARQALEGGEGGGHISLITRREGEDAVVEVVDDGPGMPAETLARCFEVYYSTKSGGSGLGLATVQRIIEAHDGRVQVESTPDRGTRVSLSLPLDPEEEADV